MSTATQMMAVRYSLDLVNDNSGEKGEKNYLDLCVIKYGANGVLELSPDFTHAKKPYRIEVNKFIMKANNIN